MRRISILHANAILYLLIACISLVYWPQLRWAAEHMPEYSRHGIAPLAEWSLYGRARKRLAEPWNLSVARDLLERSIAIDPNSEAVYGLGEYYFRVGQDEKALQQFRTYLAIDPTMVMAYLKMSAVFERRNQLPEARGILEHGLDYFSRNVEKYRPHHADDVPTQYNQKAVQVFSHYRSAVGALRREIERIEAKKSSTPLGTVHE
ncbi:MAG: hypothetical protein E4H01_01085 [Lysobacterales bacterium]|nr:MAG: hypothetical protein E4H01_01085 [Xanthomonadales bacterium]